MDIENSLHLVLGDKLTLISPQKKKYALFLNTFQSEVCIYKSQILVSGGIKNNILCSDILQYSFPFQSPPSLLSSLSTPRINHTNSIHNDTLYIIGGTLPRNQTVSCESIDLSTGIASPIPNLPIPLSLHSALVVHDHIYIAGGTTSANYIPIVPIFLYDIPQRQWFQTKIPFMKTNRPAIAQISEDFLLIFGGWAKESQIVNKGYGVSIKKKRSVVLSDFIEGEVYQSWKITGKILRACDCIGCVHTFHVPTIEKWIDFELNWSKVWENRKKLLFAYKYKTTGKLLTLPLTLIIEITRYL